MNDADIPGPDLQCIYCNRPLFEDEAIKTKHGLMHEICAEAYYPYDPNDDPGIPKPDIDERIALLLARIEALRKRLEEMK